MKDNEKSLFKNTFIIFISKFCTQFLSFFLLPLFTSILSTYEYGEFDLIATYACLLFPFMTIQLENGIFRFLIDVRKDKAKTNIIISNAFIGMLIQVLVFSIFYFIIIMTFNIENGVYIFIYSFSYMLSNVFLQVSRGLGDNISYSISSLVSGITNVAFCLLFVYICKLGLLGMVLSGIFSNLLGAIYLLFKKKILSYFSLQYFNKKDIKKLVKYSLPLVPNSLSSWIINISDKVMISWFIGSSANGIFSVSSKFSTLLSHVYSVFNLSWTESASVNSNYEERDKFFSSSIESIFKICTCLCIITIAAMPIIFRIMINESFGEAYIYIPLKIIGTIFEIFSGLLGAVYISLKFSKNIAFSTLVAGMINVVINFIFMKQYGIYAACFSTIIAYLLLSLYRFLDLKKYIKLKFNLASIASIFIMLAIQIYFYYKNSIAISLIFTLIAIIYTFILNKRLILSFSNIIIKKLRK